MNEAAENVEPIVQTEEIQNEAKPRVKSSETILKQELRAVRRDLVKAETRGKEFVEIKIEMEGHEKLVEKLKAKEEKLKAKLIKVLDLG